MEDDAVSAAEHDELTRDEDELDRLMAIRKEVPFSTVLVARVCAVDRITSSRRVGMWSACPCTHFSSMNSTKNSRQLSSSGCVPPAVTMDTQTPSPSNDAPIQ